MRQNQTILREYDAIIQDQISKGIVQIVADKKDVSSGKVHYLPHHAVVRSDKQTTKERIVYDASARSNGPSLNDCHIAGPKFDQKILNIILRFRSRRVALTAEESAFDLYVKSKDMFKSGSFDLRKFVTSSPALQDRINQAEGIAVIEPTCSPLEETYAKSILGSAQQVRSGEQKILGVFSGMLPQTAFSSTLMT